MTALTAAQVLFLHARIIEEIGGSHGIRDIGALESALARPFAAFGGMEAHGALEAKAAALLEAIVINHPFVDGNKRTAIAATGLFLLRNGRQLMASNEEAAEMVFGVADGRLRHPDIAEWIRMHTS